MNYYNTTNVTCQEVLIDKSESGQEKPWKKQKTLSERIAQAYLQFNESRGMRVYSCADFLAFKVTEGGLRLKTANFCRVRLCPMCQWRRALKVYGQMSRICENINWQDYALVKLNLTVRNCKQEDLGITLDMMAEGYRRLLQYKDIAKAVKGAYRACEITICADAARSDWFGTLHPHFHCLLLVRKSYFRSRDYISKDRWIVAWARSCKLDYKPNVDVEKVYIRPGQTITEALKEVCKYTVKDSDIVQEELFDTDKLVELLDKQLANRRFIGLSGLFKELHKQLNLSGIEDDGDLIHVDTEELSEAEQAEVVYIWRSGAYYKTEV